jgi:signal transduction histidine kinase
MEPIVPLFQAGESVPYQVYSVFEDVTEKREVEQRVRDSLRARDEFLSIASHELKTPLTTLKLQTQMRLRALAKGTTFASDKLRAFFDANSRNIDRLVHLIDDILAISRINVGKLALRSEPFDLREVVDEVLERHRGQHEATGGGVRLDEGGRSPGSGIGFGSSSWLIICSRKPRSTEAGGPCGSRCLRPRKPLPFGSRWRTRDRG